MHSVFSQEKSQIVEVVRDISRDAQVAARMRTDTQRLDTSKRVHESPSSPAITTLAGSERLRHDISDLGEAEAAEQRGPRPEGSQHSRDLLRAVLRSVRANPDTATALLAPASQIGAGPVHFIACIDLLAAAVQQRLNHPAAVRARFAAGTADETTSGGGTGGNGGSSGAASRRWSSSSRPRAAAAAAAASAMAAPRGLRVHDDATISGGADDARARGTTASSSRGCGWRATALGAQIVTAESALGTVAAEAQMALDESAAGCERTAAALREEHGTRASEIQARLRTLRSELASLEGAHSRAEDGARRLVAAAGAERDAAAEEEAAEGSAIDVLLATARADVSALRVKVAILAGGFARIDAEAARVQDEKDAEADRRAKKAGISAYITNTAARTIWRWWRLRLRQRNAAAAAEAAAAQMRRKTSKGKKQSKPAKDGGRPASGLTGASASTGGSNTSGAAGSRPGGAPKGKSSTGIVSAAGRSRAAPSAAGRAARRDSGGGADSEGGAAEESSSSGDED